MLERKGRKNLVVCVCVCVCVCVFTCEKERVWKCGKKESVVGHAKVHVSTVCVWYSKWKTDTHNYVNYFIPHFHANSSN